MLVGKTVSSLGASSTSAGRHRYTGPIGGVAATFTARRTMRSSDDGSCTIADHLVTGSAMATRSPAIWASIAW